MHALSSSIEVLEARIAPAAVIYAINGANKLYSFSADATGTLTSEVTVTGLGAGKTLEAIDFRPSNGVLYGVAVTGGSGPYTGSLYTIDLTSGVASPVGTAFSTSLASVNGLDIDFNPVVDRLRLVTSAGENLRIDPDTGTLAGTDSVISAATLGGVAYSNSYAGATTTTAFAINYSNSDLATLGSYNGSLSPNSGLLAKVADLSAIGTSVDQSGFDILTTVDGDVGFYTYRIGGGNQGFARVELATGNLTISILPVTLLDVAVQPLPGLEIPAGKSFHYQDREGDLVTVKTNAESLGLARFTMLSSEDGQRHEIVSINLQENHAFDGANLIISAHNAAGKTRHVDIGRIDATNLNLGKVVVSGNLQSIRVGTFSSTTPALHKLSVLSFGAENASGETGLLTSEIVGDLREFRVVHDVVGANISFADDVGTLTIGGSLIGNGISGSGRLSVSGDVHKFVVGGSILDGSGFASGYVTLFGTADLVKVKGSLKGGEGSQGGFLYVAGRSKSVVVAGSIVGGEASGILNVQNAAKVTVGGSIFGTANGGSVYAGEVGTFTLHGSLFAQGSNAATEGGKISGTSVKHVIIDGSVVGFRDAFATIGFTGKSNPTTAAEGVAVRTLTIGGSVVHANILFGGRSASTMTNPNASAGAISIGGDFLASSIVAGFAPGPLGFGKGDTLAGTDTLPNINATIASIVIKGAINGTPGDGDTFGIVAQELGALRIAGAMRPTKSMFQDYPVLGQFGDVFEHLQS